MGVAGLRDQYSVSQQSSKKGCMYVCVYVCMSLRRDERKQGRRLMWMRPVG